MPAPSSGRDGKTSAAAIYGSTPKPSTRPNPAEPRPSRKTTGAPSAAHPGTRASSSRPAQNRPTSTKAPVPPSRAEVEAAGLAHSCVDAIVAGFHAHAPELPTAGLEVERLPKPLVHLCDTANRALGLLSDIELRGVSLTYDVRDRTAPSSGGDKRGKKSAAGSGGGGAGPTVRATVSSVCTDLEACCEGMLAGLEALRPTLRRVHPPAAVSTTIDEATAVIHDARSCATLISKIRLVCLERDAVGARQLLDAEARRRRNQRPSVAEPRGAADDQQQHASRPPVATPLLEWLECTWLPSVELLQRLKRRAQEAEAQRSATDLRAVRKEAQREATAEDKSPLAAVVAGNETSVQAVLDVAVLQPAAAALEGLEKLEREAAALTSAAESLQLPAISAAIREAEASTEFAAAVKKQGPTGKYSQLLAAARERGAVLGSMAEVTVRLTQATRDGTADALVAALRDANQHARSCSAASATKAEAANVACDRLSKLLASSSSRSAPSIAVAWPPLQTVPHAVVDPCFIQEPGAAGGGGGGGTTVVGWPKELVAIYNNAKPRLRKATVLLAAAAHIHAALHAIASKGPDSVTLEHAQLLREATALQPGRTPDSTDSGSGGTLTPLLRDLRMHVRRAYGVTVKVHYDASTRIVSADDKMDFGAVRRAIVAALKLAGTEGPTGEASSLSSDGPTALRLRYEDEGDYVLLERQHDWELFVSSAIARVGASSSTSVPAGGGGAGLKVEVFADLRGDVATPAKPSTVNGGQPSPTPARPGLVPPSPQPRRQPTTPTRSSASANAGGNSFTVSGPAVRIRGVSGPLAKALPPRPSPTHSKGIAPVTQHRADVSSALGEQAPPSNRRGSSPRSGGKAEQAEEHDLPSEWRNVDPHEALEFRTVVSEATIAPPAAGAGGGGGAIERVGAPGVRPRAGPLRAAAVGAQRTGGGSREPLDTNLPGEWRSPRPGDDDLPTVASEDTVYPPQVYPPPPQHPQLPGVEARTPVRAARGGPAAAGGPSSTRKLVDDGKATKTPQTSKVVKGYTFLKPSTTAGSAPTGGAPGEVDLLLRGRGAV